MISHPTQEVKISTADPSAIGLFGLAMVTLVASSQKLGLTNSIWFVLPWAVFLGGFAQLFACIHDAKHNNTFGTTAFGAYALFWFGVGASWLIQMGVFGDKGRGSQATGRCLSGLPDLHPLHDDRRHGNAQGVVRYLCAD